MEEEYRIPAKYGESEFTEKKSRFIGHVFLAETEEEARECIEQVRKKHFDAKHHSWCYRLKNGAVRYSDAGEPQGTAGQPMLNVFVRENVQDVVCVVTRYFGGVLLGAGGLTRAYAKGAKDALDAAGIARRVVWDRVTIPCPYGLLERVKLELAAQDGEIENIEYGSDVTISAVLPQENTRTLAVHLRDLSAGSMQVKQDGTVYRAVPVEK